LKPWWSNGTIYAHGGPRSGQKGSLFFWKYSIFYFLGSSEAAVWGRAAPRLPCYLAQKDGCAQRTGAHARPKPTSFTICVDSLQRTTTENSKQMFPEKELRCHSLYFHIHVSVSDLYILTIYLPILLEEICGRFWEYINRSQTHEYGNWDRDHAIPRIHKWDYRCCDIMLYCFWMLKHTLFNTAFTFR